jgi:hypothetical protein
VNIVNGQFRYPLIGFVNIASGSHDLPQVGFFNWNQNDFSTLQLGFINTTGGGMEGLQMGFVNTAAGGMSGLQLGFVNTAVKSFKGMQFGFVNTSTGSGVSGLQIGFINYADSFEKGLPIGLLSIVRNGGYKAIELGVSEISPFNLSFKIGVEKLYTSFVVSYNPFRDDPFNGGIREQIILGAGLGSIIQLGKAFYLNPEITSHTAISEDFQHYVGIVPYFGYNIISNLSVAAGPSLVWAYNENIKSLFYRIVEYSINDENTLYLGARLALRFRW